MVELNRIRINMANWSGGPGVMTFYAAGTDLTPPLNALAAFADALAPHLPSPITLTVESTGDTIDEATGTMTAQWQHGTDHVATATNASSFTSGAGALVRWKTATISDGRVLMGHSFLVPLTNAHFGNDGQLTPTSVTNLQATANSLISTGTGSFRVWRRPRKATPTGISARAGTSAAITNAVVPAKPAILRTRRD